MCTWTFASDFDARKPDLRQTRYLQSRKMENSTQIGLNKKTGSLVQITRYSYARESFSDQWWHGGHCFFMSLCLPLRFIFKLASLMMGKCLKQLQPSQMHSIIHKRKTVSYDYFFTKARIILFQFSPKKHFPVSFWPKLGNNQAIPASQGVTWSRLSEPVTITREMGLTDWVGPPSACFWLRVGSPYPQDRHLNVNWCPVGKWDLGARC